MFTETASDKEVRRLGVNLTEMKSVDLRKVDRATLVDRSKVRIHPDAPVEQRVQEWIEQLGNQYI